MPMGCQFLVPADSQAAQTTGRVELAAGHFRDGTGLKLAASWDSGLVLV